MSDVINNEKVIDDETKKKVDEIKDKIQLRSKPEFYGDLAKVYKDKLHELMGEEDFQSTLGHTEIILDILTHLYARAISNGWDYYDKHEADFFKERGNRYYNMILITYTNMLKHLLEEDEYEAFIKRARKDAVVESFMRRCDRVANEALDEIIHDITNRTVDESEVGEDDVIGNLSDEEKGTLRRKPHYYSNMSAIYEEKLYELLGKDGFKDAFGDMDTITEALRRSYNDAISHGTEYYDKHAALYFKKHGIDNFEDIMDIYEKKLYTLLDEDEYNSFGREAIKRATKKTFEDLLDRWDKEYIDKEYIEEDEDK